MPPPTIDAACAGTDGGDAAAGSTLPPLGAGDRLGRYRLDAVLGGGGMGVVWRARDLDLGRDVALKLIRSGSADWAPVVARFLREARITAALRHPHLVGVHDAVESGGRAFLVMELVNGLPFSDWLAQHEGDAGRLRAAVELLAQVADGIAFAHARAIIHRDVKPANVLVEPGPPPVARVTDFGLAKEVDPGGAAEAGVRTRLTVTGQSLGTPSYMSPEQARGDDAAIGSRSDVWSLGVMLYEVLTGRTPFERGSSWETMQAVVLEEPEAPSRARPGVPAPLEGVCLRALEKDPDRRTVSAEAFAADLRAWLRGDAVQARAAGATERLARVARRRWGTLAVLGGTLVVLVAVAGWIRLERRAAAERARALVAQVAVEATRFEDSVMRTELPPEARAELAAQPLAVLERIVADDPNCGPARSWRGFVLALLGREAEAEADFGAGCELSPENPEVWRLRGVQRVERAGGRMQLPGADWSMARGIVIRSPEAPAGPTRDLLDGGLADLRRMEQIAGPSTASDVRQARALAVFHSGRADGPVAARALLEGLSGPRAAGLRGACHYACGRFAEAVAEYDATLTEWPQDTLTRRRRAFALHAWATSREAAGEDPRSWYEQALTDAEAGVAREPASTTLLRDRGTIRYGMAVAKRRRGEDALPMLEGAISDLGAALQEWPASVEIRQTRGNLFVEVAAAREERGLAAGDAWERALADYAEAIRLAPSRADGRHNLGAALVELGRSDAAHGRDPAPRHRAAIAEFDRAMEVEPDFAMARFGRANAWMLLGKADAEAGRDPGDAFERALADLDAFEAAVPGLAATRVQRGNALHRQGAYGGKARQDPRPSYRAAAAAFAEAMVLQPQLLEAVLGRGNSRLLLALAEKDRGGAYRDLLDQAIADLGEAIRLHPTHALTWTNRGNAWRHRAPFGLQAGTSPEEAYAPAIADLERALEVNPRHVDAHEILARTLHELGHALEGRGGDGRGRFAAAVARVEAGLALVPTSIDARGLRGHVGVCLAGARLVRGEDPQPEVGAALAVLDRLSSERPDAVGCRYDRGRAHLVLGRRAAARGEDPDPEFAEAEGHLKAAGEAGFAGGWTELVSLYRWTGRWTEMAAAAERAAEAQPGASDEARGQLAEARTFARLERHPQPWLRSLGRGQQRMTALHYAAARREFARGFQELEEATRDWKEASRAKVFGDPVVRGMLASARISSARIAALLSVGKAGPLAEVAPWDEATRAAYREEAFSALEIAAELGFAKGEALRGEADLAPVRDDPRWEALLARMR